MYFNLLSSTCVNFRPWGNPEQKLSQKFHETFFTNALSKNPNLLHPWKLVNLLFQYPSDTMLEKCYILIIKPEDNITLLRIFLKDNKPQKRQHKIYPGKTLDGKNLAKNFLSIYKCQIQAKTNTRDKRVSLSSSLSPWDKICALNKSCSPKTNV